MVIIGAYAPQPYRVRLAADTAPPTTAALYVLARVDGGYSQVAASTVWAVGVNTVEIALTAPLEPGVAYTVALPGSPGAPVAGISYAQPLSPVPVPLEAGEDPEAEAYGVDANWLSGVLTATGDLQEVRGRQCLLDDTLAVAMIAPRELFHRPDDGGALAASINGPSTPTETSRMAGRLRRQWLKDNRIATVDEVNTTSEAGGLTRVAAKLTEAVQQQQYDVAIPGGAG